MTFPGLLAVGGGAAIGAWLRWWLSMLLNPIFPTVPLGTLAANMLGRLFMGFAMTLLSHYQATASRSQAAVTTFSTFSAETVTLLAREQFGCAAVVVLAHLQGSILMTLVGMGIVRVVLV